MLGCLGGAILVLVFAHTRHGLPKSTMLSVHKEHSDNKRRDSYQVFGVTRQTLDLKAPLCVVHGINEGRLTDCDTSGAALGGISTTC